MIILKPHPCGESGFSLPELIIVIAIAAIIMGISIPSFVEWRKNATFRMTTNQVSSLIKRARSDAIAKGLPQRVVVRPSTDCVEAQSFNISTSSFNAAHETSCAPAAVSICSSQDGTSTADMTITFSDNGTATIAGPDGAVSGNISINENNTQKNLVTVMQTGRISSRKMY